MGTVIVSVVLGIAVAMAVVSMVKNGKSGKSLHCGGDCSTCNKCSHH